MARARDMANPAAPASRRHHRIGVTVLVAIGVAMVCWVATCFHTVAPNETAVVTRFGRMCRTAGPGMQLTWPWPIDRLHAVGTREVKRIEVAFHVSTDSPAEDRRSELLTGDENILQVTMVVQYRIRRPEQYLFSADGPDRLVRLAVETAMNQCVSRLPVDAVLTTAKSEIQSEAVETAQRLLDAYGCGVALLGGSLHEVAPPAPVSEAFKDVASAKKDSERAASEAREYVEKAVKKAGGDAQAQLSRVEGYRARRVEAARGEASHFLSLLAEYRRAREVTRTRLYVDAMERILSRAKVVIIGSEEAGVAPKITVVDSPAEAPATAPAAPAD